MTPRTPVSILTWRGLIVSTADPPRDPNIDGDEEEEEDDEEDEDREPVVIRESDEDG